MNPCLVLSPMGYIRVIGFRVIFGLYSDYIGDNGKENGNYNNGVY